MGEHIEYWQKLGSHYTTLCSIHTPVISPGVWLRATKTQIRVALWACVVREGLFFLAFTFNSLKTWPYHHDVNINQSIEMLIRIADPDFINHIFEVSDIATFLKRTIILNSHV